MDEVAAEEDDFDALNADVVVDAVAGVVTVVVIFKLVVDDDNDVEEESR